MGQFGPGAGPAAFASGNVPTDPAQERRTLARQAKAMRDALKAIEDRLAGLEKPAGQE